MPRIKPQQKTGACKRGVSYEEGICIAVLAAFATASTLAYAQRQGGNSQGHQQGSSGSAAARVAARAAKASKAREKNANSDISR